MIRGERHVKDLDRLFADLRFTASDGSTVREVGDFSAHRSERDKGIIMKRAEEMQISARAWFQQMNGHGPTLEEAKRTAKANLRIVPDHRIMETLGMSRQQAVSHCKQAAKKLADGRKPNDRQKAAFNFLAGTFIWETAFNGDDLMEDFTNTLIKVGALGEPDRGRFFECKTFVALHALTVMHMSRLRLPDGGSAPLRLQIMEKTGTLRIKANIPIADVGKPVTCSVSVFETNLKADMYCRIRPEVGDFVSEVPIEIGRSGVIEEII